MPALFTCQSISLLLKVGINDSTLRSLDFCKPTYYGKGRNGRGGRGRRRDEKDCENNNDGLLHIIEIPLR